MNDTNSVPAETKPDCIPSAPKSRRRPAVATYTPVSCPPTALTRKRLGCATDVWRDLSWLRNSQQEHFVVYDMDVRHRVIGMRIVHIGTLTGVEVHPRDVFRPAIVAAAAALILAHNHPSGDPSPSRQDLEITARLREVGELCGITVLDHVVVSADGFISLAERGWM
jgi:DNA repair protein RadC